MICSLISVFEVISVRRNALEHALIWRDRPACPSRRCIAFGTLSPWHRIAARPSRLSTDPQFVEKVRDIVGLYLDPPERALVLCVDEKSQIQALDRTQPLLPMRPGQVERRTHDYERHGTTTLFAALDVKAGNDRRQMHAAPPRAGVPQVPRRNRAQRAHRSRHARRHGQRVEPQDQTDPPLVRQASALARPLHAHILILGQSGRALLRALVGTADQARRASIRR